MTTPLVAHGNDELWITGIRLEAYIGFSPHETDVLQPLEVDLVIERRPPDTDDPQDTLDYKRLRTICAKDSWAPGPASSNPSPRPSPGRSWTIIA